MSARSVDACARDIDGFYIGISLTHWLISTGCGLICAPFTHNSACFPNDQHYCASHWRRDPADAGRAHDRRLQPGDRRGYRQAPARSEEHTSELQSLMRNSYAVFCLKKKTTTTTQHQKTSANNTT